MGGSLNQSNRVAVIAFADDLAVLEDNPADMFETLREISGFLLRKGMALNPRKCAALVRERAGGKVTTRTQPLYELEGSKIPQVTRINVQRFLGHELNASGIIRPSLTNLPIWLARVEKAPLKPAQKLAVIKSFIIPKISYVLQSPAISAQQLAAADKIIKTAVKRTLHLNIHTPDAALYAKMRDGGLGLTELRSQIPYQMLNRLTKLRAHTDYLALQACINSSSAQILTAKLERLVGPINPSQSWKEAIQNGNLTKGLEAATEDKASRTWIDYPNPHWSGPDYVATVQLRTANLPTAALPSNPADRRMCRGGCQKAETLNHVLQQCPVTHWPRICRHDEVLRKVYNFATRKWPSELEPHVRHQDGTLFKPDLVVHQPDSTTVVDVAICWEGHQPLSAAWQTKYQVYNHPKF